MVRKKGKKGGSSAAAFRACSEQVLRIRIESITLAAEKNLTDDRLVDILITAFPESYSSRNRNLLAQRVAKITRLLHRKNDAVEEPSPVSKKRRKIDESGNSHSRDEVESSINSSSLSDSTWEYGGWGGADKSDADSADRREVNDNGVGEWSDGSGGNLPLFGDLRWSRDNFLMLANLRRRVILPLHHSKLVRHCGMEPTARILFHGPSGCGKTSLARAIANDAGVPFCEISASALVSGGSPEENIRKLFSAAYAKAPSILFIDELDAMTSRMGGLEKVTEARIVKQLKACMDEPLRPSKSVNHSSDSVSSDSESSDSRPGNVLFIGATKKIDALDPALRQWFDREIAIPVPGEKTRHAILSALTQDLKVEVDLAKIARCTPGFVGGDLVALVKGARKAVVDRTMDRRIDQCYDELMAGVRHKNCQTYRQPFSDQELANLSITMDDFLTAGEMVRPSSEMEGFCTTPKAKWDDVVGLHIVKSEFERYIIKPIKFPEVYKDRDDRQQKFKNFFLYGPPGCGKTLIVEALANRTGASYIHIKTGELLEYGDQSDFLVQSLINYARSHTPCILFFDELVNIPSGSDKKQWPQIDKLRSVLAKEGNLGDVYVIGATNRVEAMKDIAWIGEQFDIVMRVPLPSPDERGEILKILARDKPVDANLDLEEIGGDRWYYSGRDLSLMMEKAVKAAIDRGGGSSKPWTIKEVDLMFGWDNTTNTISRSGNRKYKRYHETYCSAFHKCFENEDSE